MADEYRVSATPDTGRGLADVTASIISDVNKELAAELHDGVRAAGRASRTWLRGNAPKRTGEYAKDFAVDYRDEDGHCEAVVHNRRHWQLTHLLEDEHKSHNQYGGPYRTVGPAKPERHMEKAAEHGLAVLKKRLGIG